MAKPCCARAVRGGAALRWGWRRPVSPGREGSYTSCVVAAAFFRRCSSISSLPAEKLVKRWLRAAFFPAVLWAALACAGCGKGWGGHCAAENDCFFTRDEWALVDSLANVTA